MQVTAPADAEYAPAGQIEHGAPPVEKLPARHWVQVLANTAEYEPDSHEVHVDEPGREYDPEGQYEPVHDDAPLTVEYVPAGQL